MKVKNCISLVLAVSLTGIVLTYWFMNGLRGPEAPPAPSNTSPASPSLIVTAHPTRHAFRQQLTWIGTVEPQASVALTALVAGRVDEIYIEDQDSLKVGQPVMLLGGPQVEERHAKLESEINSLGSQLELARQTVEQFKQSLAAKLATKDQVAEAQDRQIRLETQLDEARQRLKTLEKQVHLSAPMTGIFTNRRVSVGQNVKAGQVLGQIIDTNRLRITANIFAPPGANLLGKEATIRVEENRMLTGTVRHVLPEAASTGAMLVWLESPQIDAQLRPGQMVQGSLIMDVRHDSLAVPESAIVYDQEEHPCLFVRRNNTFKPLNIKLGLVQDGWAEVLSGLEQDQVVVTQGAYELYYRQFNEQFKVQD